MPLSSITIKVSTRLAICRVFIDIVTTVFTWLNTVPLVVATLE